jgi:hypothetical protein
MYNLVDVPHHAPLDVLLPLSVRKEVSSHTMSKINILHNSELLTLLDTALVRSGVLQHDQPNGYQQQTLRMTGQFDVSNMLDLASSTCSSGTL